MLELIRDVRSRGIPIILISHNMPHVFEVADRIHIHRLGSRLCVIKPGDYSMSDAVAFMTGAKVPEGRPRRPRRPIRSRWLGVSAPGPFQLSPGYFDMKEAGQGQNGEACPSSMFKYPCYCRKAAEGQKLRDRSPRSLCLWAERHDPCGVGVDPGGADQIETIGHSRKDRIKAGGDGRGLAGNGDHQRPAPDARRLARQDRGRHLAQAGAAHFLAKAGKFPFP